MVCAAQAHTTVERSKFMRVWLYYRLSRDEDEELNSLMNQRSIIESYALINLLLSAMVCVFAAHTIAHSFWNS